MAVGVVFAMQMLASIVMVAANTRTLPSIAPAATIRIRGTTEAALEASIDRTGAGMTTAEREQFEENVGAVAAVGLSGLTLQDAMLGYGAMERRSHDKFHDNGRTNTASKRNESCPDAGAELLARKSATASDSANASSNRVSYLPEPE